MDTPVVAGLRVLVAGPGSPGLPDIDTHVKTGLSSC